MGSLAGSCTEMDCWEVYGGSVSSHSAFHTVEFIAIRGEGGLGVAKQVSINMFCM